MCRNLVSRCCLKVSDQYLIPVAIYMTPDPAADFVALEIKSGCTLVLKDSSPKTFMDGTIGSGWRIKGFVR